MTELPEPTPAEPTPAETASAETASAETASAEAGGKKRGLGRVLLRVVLPSALVLGLIGGGVTYTVLTVESADRTAPTRVWGPTEKTAQDRDPAADQTRGKTATPLSRLLLPLPDGYEFGPDQELYGNDGELGAAEATALMKQAGEGLSGKKRRAFEKEIDKLGLQGVGVRTFADPDNGLEVSFTVTSMKDKKQVRSSYRLRKEVLEFLEFPKGPKVQGHKDAVCHMAPQDEELDKKQRAEELDRMICLAYDSEVLVTMTASGAKPFDKARVAKLLTRQLDHIASPGEYV
ncbi:hypothetical protein ACIQK9_06070 [Streptomyces hydrogenans]|uniref:hypothetical protein n=1 Tax=Streptomyces hydrogenans TaxID=1873719 RepID=UPI0037F1984D